MSIGHRDLERYQSTWDKAEAVIREAEMPGKLNWVSREETEFRKWQYLFLKAVCVPGKRL